MNKIKATVLLSLVAASVLALSSCHDDIYYMIDQEVTLETNGISGAINSMVRYGDNLYTQNGNVYCKSNKASSESGLYNEQWTKVVDASDSSSAFYGKHCVFLASDSTYLYAYVVTWDTLNSSGNSAVSAVTIYYTTDGTTWTAITNDTLNTLLGGSDTVGTTNIKTLFCNRAVEKANRHAYVRLYSTTDSASHVYLLDGGNTPTLVSDGTNNAGSSTIQAAYYNGADYFSNYHSFTASSTYMYYAADSSVVYYANAWDSTNGYTLAAKDPTSTAPGSVDLDAGTLFDIGVTADYLLLGTNQGIAHVAITDGIPASSVSDFTNNATSALSSSYYVPVLFVLDATLPEYKTDLYGTTEHSGSYSSSTSALSKEVGLWAFYPNRNTWNKDGTADDSTSGN